VGETVREQMENDLLTEKEAVERLNRGVALAVSAGDNGTRSILETILLSEEEHIDWIETQLSAMDTLGDNAYLAEQLA
jgi:bacterioferritin